MFGKYNVVTIYSQHIEQFNDFFAAHVKNLLESRDYLCYHTMKKWLTGRNKEFQGENKWINGLRLI